MRKASCLQDPVAGKHPSIQNNFNLQASEDDVEVSRHPTRLTAQSQTGLENVGRVVWQCGFLLADYLIRRPPFRDWGGVNVVDLGAGTGQFRLEPLVQNQKVSSILSIREIMTEALRFRPSYSCFNREMVSLQEKTNNPFALSLVQIVVPKYVARCWNDNDSVIPLTLFQMM